jgi:glutamyl-tRNA synthetase
LPCSKRSAQSLGSLSLKSLADDGYEPMVVASLAVLIGGAGPVEPMPTMDALAARFDISAVGKSAAKFDTSELDALNAKLVHSYSWKQVAGRFAADELGPEPEALWNAVHGNLARVRDAAGWWQVVNSAMPVIAEEDREFLHTARACLPAAPWSETTWSEWTNRLKEATGRKGRALFMPLRMALTGLEHGPEMARLLPLIGSERTLARLS